MLLDKFPPPPAILHISLQNEKRRCKLVYCDSIANTDKSQLHYVLYLALETFDTCQSFSSGSYHFAPQNRRD
jgi:hypothetical protein